MDDLTGGNGQEWMVAFLGNTTLASKDQASALVQASTPGQHITLPSWLSGSYATNIIYLESGSLFTERWIAHEFGHIWDINSGKITTPWGALGGVADRLNSLVGGGISDPRINCRYCAGSGTRYLPVLSQYNPGAYGNNSTADYLAETFTFGIYPGSNPGGNIGTVAASNWVKVFIISQSNQLP